MKLFTDEIQTAKLIEFGFEKPRYATMFWRDNKEVTEINYILGELLSFLPNYFRDKNKNLHTLSIYTGELGTWEINYIGFESRIRTCEYELIDAAFEMCVKLKEDGEYEYIEPTVDIIEVIKPIYNFKAK